MSENEKYTAEFSSDEIHSLMECLAELRKYYADSANQKATDNPVFVAACKLQHKLAHIVNPETNVSLEEYLTYGS